MKLSGKRIPVVRRCVAWSVHLFTASGVICCLFSLEATIESQWRGALTWLVVAVVIDAVDGTLARLARVKQVVPEFDGALLDNLIDYVSYVILPAFIIHRAEVLPTSISFGLLCAICIVSAWQFCQSDAKTADHFFKGFPCYWNVAALYLLAMQLSTVANTIIVVGLLLMVFVPVKYIYLSRNVPYPTVTMPLTVVWAAMVCLILWQFPDPHPLVLWSSLGYLAYYFCLSLFVTISQRKS